MHEIMTLMYMRVNSPSLISGLIITVDILFNLKFAVSVISFDSVCMNRFGQMERQLPFSVQFHMDCHCGCWKFQFNIEPGRSQSKSNG